MARKKYTPEEISRFCVRLKSNRQREQRRKKQPGSLCRSGSCCRSELPNNFDKIYGFSLLFLVGSAGYARVSGGVVGYGGTGIQGQVYGSAGGGMSLGPAASRISVAKSLHGKIVAGIALYKHGNS